MSTTTDTKTTARATGARTCGCGCGAEVAREFRPGHDARLKSALVTASRSPIWQVREAAVEGLIARAWTHFAAAEDIARCQERGPGGHRVTDIRGLATLVTDEAGTSHAHNLCARKQGATTRHATDAPERGWLCSECIGTTTPSERAGRARQIATAIAADPIGQALAPKGRAARRAAAAS